MKTLIITLSLILIAGGMGCAAFSHYVTPAEIDQDAVNYAVAADVADPVDYDGYPNMVKAERLKKDVDAAHNVIQLDLTQQMQTDSLTYSIHKDVVSSNLAIAQQREETLFGETGLLSLGLSMLGAGGFAGLLGLSRKRPGDITKPEMEQAVAQATGRTVEELSIRDKQFVQLVKGVQAFMENPVAQSSPVVVDALKVQMNIAQDKDTQAAVAVVKKTA